MSTDARITSPFDRTHPAARKLDRRCRGRSLGRLRQSGDGLALQRPSRDRCTSARWRAIATHANPLKIAYNPFISHDFLSALGGSRARSGREPAGSPCTCSPRTPAARSSGAVPCYVKSHSRGEYVFDHGWAEAYERAGGSYYPKLQVAVPFTPATGRRLLVRPGPHAEAVRGGAGRRAGRRLPALRRLLGPRHLPARAGMAAAGRARLSRSAPTSNSIGRTPATTRFDAFLGALASRKRKTIRRERARRARHRHQRALADRLRPDRKRVGRLLRVLHGDRLAQMGPALSHARVLFARRRARCATASCW